MWTAMMAAMMLPGVSPLVRLYGRSAATIDQLLLIAAYLGVWVVIGVVAYAADNTVEVGATLVLLAAAVYEVTPLKHLCLRHCRRPVDFLFRHWRRGRIGALRVGLAHAAYCVGCCWALMAVLVLAAAMSFFWAAVLAVVITAQKLLPVRRGLTEATALALIVAAIVTAIV